MKCFFSSKYAALVSSSSLRSRKDVALPRFLFALLHISRALSCVFAFQMHGIVSCAIRNSVVVNKPAPIIYQNILFASPHSPKRGKNYT